ncbi:MAG TPA: hypothetical protein VFI23_11210 [Rhizomicrobium sp.]|nr:hypothetical protein [Rhizomicrobium sp.]
MISAEAFPLPFHSLRTIGGGGNSPFIVGAMFTAAYSEQAARLAASCEKFSLSYVLHEVPAVHASISPRGSADLSFTKANFIHHLLNAHGKPVLYLDADCEFVARPDLVTELAQSGCDFAIYNWLADEYTDIFKPMEIALADSPPAKGRFFRHAGGIDWYSTTQLTCSGLVQFYGNSRAARALLSRWHRTVASFAGCADDQCLDFTFNNLGKTSWLYWFLKTRWLPKAYARIAFWIYAEPVINHPEFPGKSAWPKIKDPRGRQQRYQSLLEKRDSARPVPKDCIIDTEQGQVCKLVEGQIVPIGPTQWKFWL